jgi:hypothetical protein
MNFDNKIDKVWGDFHSTLINSRCSCETTARLLKILFLSTGKNSLVFTTTKKLGEKL